MSAVHCSYLFLGALGLILLFARLNVSQRAALLIIVFVGLVSVLTGGALYSPRFRIPLDIALVVGTTNCIAWIEAWVLIRRTQAKENALGMDSTGKKA
jgi:hypothetical protein